MTIQPKEYNDLKEYWDYQRKIQYNKEQIFAMAERFEGRAYNDFGPMDINQVKRHLWDRIKAEEYENPPEDWVPEDPKYRLWYETGELRIKDLSPKARQVVLRANPKRQQVPGILNDDNDI